MIFQIFYNQAGGRTRCHKSIADKESISTSQAYASRAKFGHGLADGVFPVAKEIYSVRCSNSCMKYFVRKE